MRAEPGVPNTDVPAVVPPGPFWALPAVVLAGLLGFGLLADSARSSSATYDEVAYMRIAARWWRTGEQEEITRMGSPLTFWKLQMAPVFWTLDQLGRRELADDPIGRQSELLPLARIGSLWIWCVAFVLTAWWSRSLHGPGAMVLAAWLFVLGPNLLAHGALVTMELPLVATWLLACWLFARFLDRGEHWPFWTAAATSGLAFSCKFTAVLLPPILGLAWWCRRVLGRREGVVAATVGVARGMIGFGIVMLAADVLVTGGAVLPLSHTRGQGHPVLEGRLGPRLVAWATWALETPLPQDLVGFATQMHHQRSGGPSYLLGERRMWGWWYYYLVALAVKTPLGFGLILAARAFTTRRSDWNPGSRDGWIPLAIAAFLVVTALGSSRNYGLRYLLPLSPLAIVWVSRLAEQGRPWRMVAWAGLVGQALAVASVHPHELTYFNGLAGGTPGGRGILADSNLDWGQGLRALGRLQAARPEIRELTLYYFGDTDPRHYGIVGKAYVIDAHPEHPGLPPRFTAETAYVGVSASLRHGPWGPRDYFRALDGVAPVAWTDDGTIAIHRVRDVAEMEPPSAR